MKNKDLSRLIDLMQKKSFSELTIDEKEFISPLVSQKEYSFQRANFIQDEDDQILPDVRVKEQLDKKFNDEIKRPKKQIRYIISIAVAASLIGLVVFTNKENDIDSFDEEITETLMCLGRIENHSTNIIPSLIIDDLDGDFLTEPDNDSF